MTFNPTDIGWHLGRSQTPRGVDLWCRYDRTCGVYGEQGSGKTLDLLAPALLAHTGPAMATLTKLDDLLLTAGRRQAGGRPIAVLDPFGAAPGLPELIWDPVAGCVDPKVAEKRAKAFAAGTIAGAVTGGRQDNAARFYAAETAKVLQGFLHAAALTGRNLEHVLEWVANPVAAEQPAEILRQHPHAARFWDGLLTGALHGSADTVSNTVTTVQQAFSLFFQPDIRARCVPSQARPATDVAELIARSGTVYLLGREDPYASAAPLMTAVAENVLDTALWAATTAPHGRLTPTFLACLDELPSTTPLPTLRTRMANERALGLSFIYAAQTWKQMVVCYGEDEARALFGLTNNLVIFGGGKDIHFYREISELLDDVRVSRQTVNDGPGGIGTSRAYEDIRILRPGDLRRIPERHALVIAGNAPPILARLRRCFDGRDGKALLGELRAARASILTSMVASQDVATLTAAALEHSRRHQLIPFDSHLELDDRPWVQLRPSADPLGGDASRHGQGWT
jgi:type IV secretory pathway TraG/TraD family ATPase VirD4